MCGVKGNFQTIGVNGRVKLNDCDASNDTSNHVQSLISWAQRSGKGTGIVTLSFYSYVFYSIQSIFNQK